jgi:hypothetical protein
VALADAIFNLLTNDEVFDPHACNFFLFGLIINEINEQNLQEIPNLIRRQVEKVLQHLQHTEGFVTRRCFKQYLIS